MFGTRNAVFWNGISFRRSICPIFEKFISRGSNLLSKLQYETDMDLTVGVVYLALRTVIRCLKKVSGYVRLWNYTGKGETKWVLVAARMLRRSG